MKDTDKNNISATVGQDTQGNSNEKANIYVIDEPQESVAGISTEIESGVSSGEEIMSNAVKGKRTLPKGAHILYLVIAGLAFVAFTVVFLFFPRTTYSELEKRDLASFPDMGKITEKPAELTAEISQWFSDSEPFRDSFMTLSMGIRDALRYSLGSDEEMVSFRPAAQMADASGDEDDEDDYVSNPLAEAGDHPMANENAKIANAGIVIVGSGEKVRALMAFGGGEKAGKSYIELVNEYADAFPSAHIYALVAPLATEFYLPDKAAEVSRSQRAPIEYIRQNLSHKARFVDAYSALAAHVNEDIYLRTDHHWAPLGGYYAAREIARTAGVPFRELDSYDKHVVKRFVGSMYGYSKDISVKNAPEDFVYYTPRGLDYKTTYITYNTNKDYQIVSESKPHEGKFFHHFKDGSGSAYLTFMGGDQHLVKVETGTPGNRRLMIIKDSYGNTLPGYMFYSFSEVHVVDFRYFKRNMAKYVADNRITDIVIAFNIFNACNRASISKVRNFLTQSSGNFAPAERHSDVKAPDGQQSHEPAPAPVNADKTAAEKAVTEKPVEKPVKETVTDTVVSPPPVIDPEEPATENQRR